MTETVESAGIKHGGKPHAILRSDMFPAIQALIFDLDDTLVVEEASAEAAFIETGHLAYARYGLDPRLLHMTVRKTCRELWYAFPAHPFCKRVGISSWEGMWAEFIGPDRNLAALRDWAHTYRFESWQNALRVLGVDDPGLAAELAEAFPRLRRQKHIVYADAIPVLEQLTPNYALALLTNGAPDLQRRKLEGSGLAAYFKHVLISGDIGFGKPDPRIFNLLLNRLQTSPGTALMIGNSLSTDVQGAKGVQMRSVWINRSNALRDANIIPDWEFSSLHQIPFLLATLSN